MLLCDWVLALQSQIGPVCLISSHLLSPVLNSECTHDRPVAVKMTGLRRLAACMKNPQSLKRSSGFVFKYAAYVSFSTFASESRPNMRLFATVSASSAVLSKAFSALQLIPDVFSPSGCFLPSSSSCSGSRVRAAFFLCGAGVSAGRREDFPAVCWNLGNWRGQYKWSCLTGLWGLSFLQEPSQLRAAPLHSSLLPSAHCLHSRGEKDKKAWYQKWSSKSFLEERWKYKTDLEESVPDSCVT